MHFTFTPHPKFNYLERFAEKFNASVSDNQLTLPNYLGKGFIKRFMVNRELTITIHRYNLKQPLLLKRVALKKIPDTLIFRFIYFSDPDKNHLSNVQVLTPGVNIEDNLVPGSPISYTIISLKTTALLSTLGLDSKNEKFLSFYKNVNSPFVFQKNMTFEIKKILKEIYDKIENEVPDEFETLYFTVKVQELIYIFFSSLFNEQKAAAFQPINPKDIAHILSIEKLISTEISIPPRLKDLSQKIGMSETKMKYLFKTIFGTSIYHHYQAIRMSEAARLLSTNRTLSVSQVGYTMGFSNLSHFSRIFKAHIGVNPGEFSGHTKKTN